MRACDERERAGDRADRAVETELAEHADIVEHAGRQTLVGGEQPERDRELEPGAGSCAPTPAPGSP